MLFPRSQKTQTGKQLFFSPGIALYQYLNVKSTASAQVYPVPVPEHRSESPKKYVFGLPFLKLKDRE